MHEARNADSMKVTINQKAVNQLSKMTSEHIDKIEKLSVDM